jgi:hypothetical protein
MPDITPLRLHFPHDTRGEQAYTQAMACTVNNAGATFWALIVQPPAPRSTQNAVDTQYCVIIREDLDGSRREIKRYNAADSRAWINARSSHQLPDNGKYGTVTIVCRGNDLVIGLSIRADHIQTNIRLIEPGLGI